MSRLLLVEDDRTIATSLAEILAREGHACDVAETLASARLAMSRHPELVILDWMLPDGQGIDLLREWREAGNTTPVIVLTARTDVVDRVLGLELGADDYVTKPFEVRELIARIRARLRRHAPDPVAAAPLRCGDLELCPETRDVRLDGRPVHLARMEFDLLHLFVRSPNRVFTRDEILNRVWGYDAFPTTRTVDTHVLQLRNKPRADLIETVRGVGYRLVSKS